jgi:hypothetical protein
MVLVVTGVRPAVDGELPLYNAVEHTEFDRIYRVEFVPPAGWRYDTRHFWAIAGKSRILLVA